MAEEDNASPEDRTLEPSLRRREEFRSEGRVAMSRDVMTAGHLMALALGFAAFGAELYESLREITRLATYTITNEDPELWSTFVDSAMMTAGPMLGIAFVGMAGLIVAGLGQTRMLFAIKLVSFKLSRINPLEKIKELFGPKKAAVRVGLALGKVAFTGLGLWLVVSGMGDVLPSLALTSVGHADAVSQQMLWQMLLATIGAIMVIAVLDYVWQHRQLMGKMRMTIEEAKREREQSEGKPQYKHRRRQMHRELTANRIIEAVPKADVIITNPTHLAVALRYRAGEDTAPIVTAKGADELAAIMRDIARQHAIPLVENKPVARELWRRVRVGGPVPQSLFAKVAEILARVYKARRPPGLI